MENNAAGVTPHVNLVGVAIGNGFVAPYEMVQGVRWNTRHASIRTPSRVPNKPNILPSLT